MVGSGASVSNTTSYGADIGPEATVGPYTFLRPGTRLGRGAKAGGFVEMKAAVVGDGAKVPHLSYVGDATIGEGSNIGAGTIFANYDGVAKHHTEVGSHSFVGSDSVLVAPVEIADGSYVAAGSTITNKVSAGELAVAPGQAAQHRRLGRAAQGRHPYGGGSRAGRRRRQPGSREVGRMSFIKATGEKKLMLFAGRAHPELADAVATGARHRADPAGGL